MAVGEHRGLGTAVDTAHRDLPEGAAVTESGRVSVAEVFREPSRADHPFSPVQLSRLDEALTLASRETGLRFSVYLGDLGPKPSDRVGELHSVLEGASEAVLVAVSPGQRIVEVRTGAEARLPDRGAKLAVMSMVASFREGDLIGGLLSGLRMLADQVGGRPRTR
ncbi:DUF5130 family protein [Pseudonocardia asaccharolytica]|uniref:DUF5130 domain-containing protein n=1 Tax=Pseudonocardia asaccharolytica DSM 44247 = NBRC 16224 TaxID=1123024 RepID=A0A511D7M5_9PSEU|nr:DUF5130 family protein [Pseudonocardia asaccharolytica]GEL20800.1 hypothetical protein PA7_46370 [Pseudonocardia asaccharolytica DSM 44247 = NBRC 16224]